MTTSRHRGKNIVLCSDGTGNSGGKGRGTNVWRLFNALDLDDPAQPQVAFYDDGVGSQDFALFKILGGAFGWGLSRNIRDLYRFLVRQYDPGDRVYLFGFSRGAHTVRLLSDLIARVGVLKRPIPGTGDGADSLGEKWLDDKVLQAQKAYLAGRCKTRAASAATGDDGAWAEVNEFRKAFCHAGDATIALLGVWDTVDAVGVPIDEIREGLDIFTNVAIKDRRPAPNVLRAVHALSIDDARHTFHPVMWEAAPADPDQLIEQVWFAGVHSNVGGGYPKDQMALVSLEWMLGHAREAGLSLQAEPRERWRREANVQGRLYDSRAGLAAYYRYRPRDIGRICAGNGIERPRVHHSVLRRIEEATAGYAPVALPPYFEVEPQAGSPAGAAEPASEGNAARECFLDYAWDLVWWRRRLYFALLAVTLAFVIAGFTLDSAVPASCSAVWCLLEPVFAVVDAFAPDFLADWVSNLRSYPLTLLGFVVAFILLLLTRGYLRRRTDDACNAAYYALGPPFQGRRPEAMDFRPGPWERRLLGLARRLRESPLFSDHLPHLTARIGPWLVMLLVVAALAWGIWWACSDTRVELGSTPSAHLSVITKSRASEPVSVVFDTREPCFAAYTSLQAGERYRFDVEVLEPWRDATLAAKPGEGVESVPWPLRFATPFRRAWGEPWFVLMASTSCGGRDQFRVVDGEEVEVESSGPLYFFVNDAVCYWCPDGIWHYYANNQGTARITVTPMGSAR